MANVKKTVTDAGYIAIGLTVMGFQQAQVRGRELRDRAAQASDCVGARVHTLQEHLGHRTEVAKRQAASARTQAKDRAQTQVRTTVAKTKELHAELNKRVEPVVGQVQDRLSELPERVVQAMEPVTARVRELSGNAA